MSAPVKPPKARLNRMVSRVLSSGRPNSGRREAEAADAGGPLRLTPEPTSPGALAWPLCSGQLLVLLDPPCGGTQVGLEEAGLPTGCLQCPRHRMHHLGLVLHQMGGPEPLLGPDTLLF